jgi:hypothetical protein
LSCVSSFVLVIESCFRRFVIVFIVVVFIEVIEVVVVEGVISGGTMGQRE